MGEPLTTEEFISRHKADLQACGFDIQFVAFVNFLFDIKGGDVIAYEKKMTLLSHALKVRNGLFKLKTQLMVMPK